MSREWSGKYGGKVSRTRSGKHGGKVSRNKSGKLVSRTRSGKHAGKVWCNTPQHPATPRLMLLAIVFKREERLIDCTLHTTSAIVDSIRRGSGTVVVHVGSQQHAGAPAKQGQADKAPHPARGGATAWRTWVSSACTNTLASNQLSPRRDIQRNIPHVRRRSGGPFVEPALQRDRFRRRHRAIPGAVAVGGITLEGSLISMASRSKDPPSVQAILILTLS